MKKICLLRLNERIELFIQSKSNKFLYSNNNESQFGNNSESIAKRTGIDITEDNRHGVDGTTCGKVLGSNYNDSPSATDHYNIYYETNQSLSNSNSQLRKAVSTSAHNATTTTNLFHVSHLSRSSQTTVEAITQFFYDEPDLPYHPPPPHKLEDSPCKSIIRLDNHSLLYNCTLHPDFQSYHLESIEHHIKYKNPEMHESEILKLLKARI